MQVHSIVVDLTLSRPLSFRMLSFGWAGEQLNTLLCVFVFHFLFIQYSSPASCCRFFFHKFCTGTKLHCVDASFFNLLPAILTTSSIAIIIAVTHLFAHILESVSVSLMLLILCLLLESFKPFCWCCTVRTVSDCLVSSFHIDTKEEWAKHTRTSFSLPLSRLNARTKEIQTPL